MEKSDGVCANDGDDGVKGRTYRGFFYDGRSGVGNRLLVVSLASQGGYRQVPTACSYLGCHLESHAYIYGA